jgi:periplasmic copper chaperone A
MTHQLPGRSLSSIAVALLGLMTFHTDAGASEAIRIAQMQTGPGGQSAPAGNTTFRLGDLVVTSPWTRATPGGAKIAGGYLKIANNGKTADRFLGAKSGPTDHVEIHEMSMNDGVMKMRPLPDGGLEIKPGETVELKSGGYHLMFMDLTQPLKQGDTFRATLQFEKAGPLDVNFSVRALGATNGESPAGP